MARSSTSTRERILEAAVSLLRKAGVKKLAQPQVAREAGVPQGHLTYYFPKKADLLAAVADRFIEMMATDLRQVLGEDAWDVAEDKIRERMLNFVAKLVRDKERTRMLLGLIVEAENDPALRKTLVENALRVRGVLARVLRRDPSHPDVNLVLATMWGLGLQHLVFGEARSDEETDLLLRRLPLWFGKLRERADVTPLPDMPRASMPSEPANLQTTNLALTNLLYQLWRGRRQVGCEALSLARRPAWPNRWQPFGDGEFEALGSGPKRQPFAMRCRLGYIANHGKPLP